MGKDGKMDILVESALLTHGLASVTDEELLRLWPLEEKCIAWMDGGALHIGNMAEFLPFRAHASEIVRVSAENYDKFASEKRSCAMTASATMLAASRLGIPVAVTCGMGGIGEIRGETLCPDLPAVRDLPVVLVAATPKDVVDIGATLRWFAEEGVPVYGRSVPYTSGFMCVEERHPLRGVWEGGALRPPLLLLNPIAEEERLHIPGAVEQAKAAAGDKPILRLLPIKPKKYGVVTTGSEVLKGIIQDTFTPVIDEKMGEYGCHMIAHSTPGDDDRAITAAIKQMIADGAEMVICTGGMSVDPDDRTPLAIRNSGGRVVTYGAPVLPGAMFLLSYNENGIPVCGLPGCVMYAKRTIFDIVLPYLLADEPVTAELLSGLGNGGLCLNCKVCHYPNCGFGKGA